MPTDLDIFLAHYGVLGMRWGVRKDRESSGRRSSAKSEVSKSDIAVLKSVFPGGVDLAAQKAKYGPGSLSGKQTEADKRFTLTDDQKHALKVAGAILVIGGGLYAANKYLPYGMGALKGTPFQSKLFFADQAKHLGKRSLKDLSTESVNLAPGSILKRVSTAKETSIRPGGFFAAHKEDDVTRYKAAIPVFWKLWGTDTGKGGYVTHIRADKGVKAPSPKETLDLFNEFFGSRPQYGLKPNDKDSFFNFAHLWASDSEHSTDVKGFFEFVQSKGYNSLVDLNDAGALGEQPLRMISSNGFSIVKNERLTPTNISEAQKTIRRIKHYMEALNDNTEEFLSHYGVKGMRWGVRKERRAEAYKKMTPNEKRAYTNKRNARREMYKAGAAFAATTGALFVTSYLSGQIVGSIATGSNPVSDIRNSVRDRKDARLIKNVMTAHGKLKVADISDSVRRSAIDV